MDLATPPTYWRICIIVGIISLTLNRISYYKTIKNKWNGVNPQQWYYTKFPEKWANDLYQKKIR